MENKYIITDLRYRGHYLQAVSLSKTREGQQTSLMWTYDQKKAIQLNIDEAIATINFIIDVINQEEGVHLHAMERPD